MRSTLLELVRRRGPDRTLCLSDAARELMEDVRQEAYRLADDWLVGITQRGRVVDGRTAAELIRVCLRRTNDEPATARE